MSVSTVPIIMARIKFAEPRSPIAVFVEGNGDLDAVFAATQGAKHRMKTEKLVGVYDKTMPVKEVRTRISAASLRAISASS